MTTIREVTITLVHSMWLLLIIIFVPSCSMVSSPPVGEYMDDQQIDYYEFLDIAPLREVEDRLTKAYAEQVDWDEYDQEVLLNAINAIKSEFEWMKYKVLKGDKIRYYDAKVANEKVNHFWDVARKILDNISIDGAVDSDTSLIYHFVRKDITANLNAWNQSLDRAEADINGKIKAYDAAQVKKFVESVEPLIGKLPFL